MDCSFLLTMKLFYLLLIFVFIICPNGNAQNYELQLDPFLQIGEESSDSTEYLFGGIQVVKKYDNLFVADRSDNAIRVYSPSGTFIQKIGRRGRGPGDFLDVSDFFFKDKHLYVLDARTPRVTVFDENFEYKESYSLATKDQRTYMGLFPDGSDGFLMLSTSLFSTAETAELLMRYDSTLSPTSDTYLNPFGIFFGEPNPFLVFHSNASLLYLTKIKHNTIAVTPQSYTGNVAIFNAEDYSFYTLGEAISNFYELDNWEDKNRIRETGKTGYVTLSGFGERYFYKLKGANFGLVGNSQFLLNFYGMFEGKDIIPFMDVYTADGEFLAKIPLQDHPVQFIKNKIFSIKPHFLDEDNNLYVSDYYYEGSYPAVVGYKTNLNELLPR